VDTWPSGRGITTIDHVLTALTPWLAEAEGVTISGGEPFDQPDALCELLVGLRALTCVTIFVYSGYPFEKLAPWLREHPHLIDALMSDPYDASVPQTLALRGSDNQRLHLLTAHGASALASFERLATTTDRKLDAMFDADGSVWFAGIPARGDLARLRAVLVAMGHDASVSEGSA
jgi:anaerobic ribonucleoside-triphosphate reductase activating protein